jgi:hypothetical protein
VMARSVSSASSESFGASDSCPLAV